MIVRVLDELGPFRGLKTKRKALRAAYPFGPRRGWPYRVWLDEVRINLGMKKPPRPYREPLADSPGQMWMFQ